MGLGSPHRALLLLLAPPVASQTRRLVQIEELDHEQYHKADSGVVEVAPKPFETGTFASWAASAIKPTVGMCKSKITVAKTVNAK